MPMLPSINPRSQAHLSMRNATPHSYRFPFPEFSPVQGISGARAWQPDVAGSICERRRSGFFREQTERALLKRRRSRLSGGLTIATDVI